MANLGIAPGIQSSIRQSAEGAIQRSIPDITFVEIDAVRHDSRPKIAYSGAPRPACGERTKVRGLVDPLSETALGTKIILRESRFQPRKLSGLP